MKKHEYRPIKTYEVTVKQYGSAKYAARAPGTALGNAYRAFKIVNERIRFAEFMTIAKVTRVKDPAGVGERIVVTCFDRPETVTRCYGPTGQYVYFMRDGSDQVLHCHPLDVMQAGRAAA